MRIAIFSDNFYPELSGISDSITLLATELARDGHRVRFYVPRYSAKDFHKVHAQEQELALGEGIDIVRLPALPYPTGTGQGRMVVPLGWTLRSLYRWKPDILHVQQFYGVGLEAVMTSRLLQVPLVGTVHESASQFVGNSPVRGAAGEWLLKKYSAWFYDRCAYVTAPSGFLFPELTAYGFHRPHRVLSNPIAVDRFHPADGHARILLRDQLGIRGPAVLYAGRLAPEKHIDVCLRAFARVREQVPTAEFLISGQGVSGSALRVLSRELGIERSVKFLGYLEPGRLVSVYQAADVFAVASTAEMQCLAMLQAMACRLPVVAVNAGGLPEYVPAGVGYILPVGDVPAFAQKLELLLTDDDLRTRMGASAFGYVQQFRPSMVARAWIELYRQQLSPRACCGTVS